MNFNIVKKPKILVLDDDPVARKYIHMTLADDGDIILTEDVRNFFEMLDKGIPDIFLLDVNLPDGNGIDLCRDLRNNSLFQDSFIIILTTKNDRESIEKAYSAGADEYIRKPFISFELVSKIRIIQHIIRGRDTLRNAYQTQLDHNVQLYKLSSFIKNGIVTDDRDVILRNSEVLNSIIDLSYMEIIKVKDGVPLSISQKQANKNTEVVKFRDIEKDTAIIRNIENEVKYLKIRKKNHEIYISVFSLKFNNTAYGYILIEREEPFTQNDKEIISLYIDYTTLLNERISYQNELFSKNDEFKKEIEIIRKLEVSKLPDFKLIQGYDTAFAFMPARELSGDFFDGFFLDDDIYQIILCDVSGHGIASSYVGNQIRTLFRQKSSSGKKPSEIAREINEEMSADLSDFRFYCTAQIIQIYLDTNTILFLSAGHPEAVISKNSNRDISLTGNRSPVIGLFMDEEYSDEIIEMKSGDFLFLYTDGLTEEHSTDYSNMYGLNRLIESIKETESAMASNELVHHCLGDFYEFNGYRPQHDDITLICIKKL